MSESESDAHVEDDNKSHVFRAGARFPFLAPPTPP